MAKVELIPGCRIFFHIESKGYGDEADKQRIKVGAEYLAMAQKAEPRVRERVADDLLDLYNRSWADDDVEGRPPMNRAQFLTNITPSELRLDLEGTAFWYYACGDLFRGQQVLLLLGPDLECLGKAKLFEHYPEEDEDEEQDDDDDRIESSGATKPWWKFW